MEEAVVNPAYMVLAIAALGFVAFAVYLALPQAAGKMPGRSIASIERPVSRSGSMQKIEVVVQPECLSGVSEALRKAKIGPFRASDVTIFDPTKAPEGSYRGAKYAIGRERVKVELVLPDHETEPAVEAIRDAIDAFGQGDAELVVLVVQDSMHLSPSPWTRPRAIR